MEKKECNYIIDSIDMRLKELIKEYKKNSLSDEDFSKSF